MSQPAATLDDEPLTHVLAGLRGAIVGLAIVIAVAVAINLLLKVLVERRFNEGRLGRMIRSFRSRARAVVVASIDRCTRGGCHRRPNRRG